MAAKLGWSPNRGIKVRFACFVCQESFYINIGGDGRGLGGGERDHVFQANVLSAGLARRLENHCPVESLHPRETHKKVSW